MFKVVTQREQPYFYGRGHLPEIIIVDDLEPVTFVTDSGGQGEYDNLELNKDKTIDYIFKHIRSQHFNLKEKMLEYVEKRINSNPQSIVNDVNEKIDNFIFNKYKLDLKRKYFGYTFSFEKHNDEIIKVLHTELSRLPDEFFSKNNISITDIIPNNIDSKTTKVTDKKDSYKLICKNVSYEGGKTTFEELYNIVWESDFNQFFSVENNIVEYIENNIDYDLSSNPELLEQVKTILSNYMYNFFYMSYDSFVFSYEVSVETTRKDLCDLVKRCYRPVG